MIYRQRNKKRNLGIKIVGIIILILVALRIFGIQPFSSIFNNSFNSILQVKSGIFSPIKNSATYFKSKKDLEEERKRLLAENTDLKLKELTSRMSTAEYDLFMKTFGDFSTTSPTFRVILKPPFLPFDSIRISGNLEGYDVGNLVFYQNVVIGSITEKTNQHASVQLFSSPGLSTPALIGGTQFEAKGLGGGRFVMEVAKDFPVNEGDPVIYPQEQLVLLGAVGQIESVQEDLFKKVYFNTPVPLDSISYVTIGQQPYEQIQPTN